MMSMQLVTELGVVDVDHLRWTEALVKKTIYDFSAHSLTHEK